MASPLTTPSGPIRLGTGAQTPFVPVVTARIRGGLWGERRRINREVSVPHAWERLQAAGNFANLELAAATGAARRVRQRAALPGQRPLQVAGGDRLDPGRSRADRGDRHRAARAAVRRHRAAASGAGRGRLSGLPLPGPLSRRTVRPAALGARALLRWPPHPGRRGGPPSDRRERLLDVARRFADLITRSFGTGEGQVDGVCGHPEIETALVELHRETGESAYLDPAQYFIDRRGHGLLGDGPVRPAVLPRSPPGPGAPGGRPVTPCASCTCWPGWRTWRRDRRATRSARRRSGSGARWHRHPDLPDRRHRCPPHGRGVRRPVRAAERAQLLRDLRGHRVDHVLPADAAPHR